MLHKDWGKYILYRSSFFSSDDDPASITYPNNQQERSKSTISRIRSQHSRNPTAIGVPNQTLQFRLSGFNDRLRNLEIHRFETHSLKSPCEPAKMLLQF